MLGTSWGILASATCNNQGRFMGWGGGGGVADKSHSH